MNDWDTLVLNELVDVLIKVCAFRQWFLLLAGDSERHMENSETVPPLTLTLKAYYLIKNTTHYHDNIILISDTL